MSIMVAGTVRIPPEKMETARTTASPEPVDS